ncbi:MAG: hypothetical protein EA370_09690 [Wenzhouxiangella sp.]|nr:MAG: hypothetical protein EA370_09690 [Wenzhouxiangella sp.]
MKTVISLIAAMVFSGFILPALANSDVARLALAERADSLGLSSTDIADIEVTDHYRTRHNGVEHVWLRQRIDGLPVALGLANVNIGPGGRIWSVNSRFAANAQARTAGRQPTLTALEALQAYARARRLDFDDSVQQARSTGTESFVFKGGVMADGDIPATLAWLEHQGQLHLVWDLAVDERGRADWFNAFIDAHSGEILKAVNWTQESGYRVFAEPLEHPGEGEDTLVMNPADPDASPLGWHDTGNTQYTDTRGNNVWAQEDTLANNTGGRRPDGGAELLFDFPIDLTSQQPPEYENFAITNLFYWNNLLHDVLWHYGFDEPAGNFQINNFGRGGQGGDPVLADAQDGSGTNNANFSTPPDGTPARMQMFIWTAPGGNPAELRISEPAASAGNWPVATVSWGQSIGDPGTTGILELVSDGTALPDQGCEPLTGFTPGNIALVRRGSCEFGLKALNAQQAGASAVIVINNDGGNGTINMGAGNAGGQVNIPVAMIGNLNGNLIVADLGNAIEGVLVREDAQQLNRDSDLDAGVIAHEYGHGLSIRLTGGPSTSSCLFGGEQAGEGWSDFLGLWITAKAEDTEDQPRGIGSYLIFQENIPGATIRPAPYIRDMSINPLTYDRVRTAGPGGVSIPHGVGSVYNTIIWDLYWNLVNRYGFDEDFHTGSGGNNILMQLVVDSLKLQPCGPTFVTNREAMLLADQIAYDGANQCEIWEAFARRGVGVNASDGGSSQNLSGIVEDFTVPESCEQPDLIPGLGIAIEATVNDAAVTGPVAAGDVIDYVVTVSNTGNIGLADINLTDSFDPPLVCNSPLPLSLAEGESSSCSSSLTVSQAEIDAGQAISRQASASAPDPTVTAGSSLEAQAISVIQVEAAAPAIRLLKQVSPAAFTAAGDTLTYRFTLENTGNVTLDDIVLTDEMLGGEVTCEQGSLAPGASLECGPLDYIVTADDVLAGSILNQAEISAKAPDGTETQASDAVTANEDRVHFDRFEELL